MNIFEQLGFPPQEAADLMLRTRLMQALKKHIHDGQMTQLEAASLMGVDQADIGYLLNGKINNLSSKKLTGMASLAKISVPAE